MKKYLKIITDKSTKFYIELSEQSIIEADESILQNVSSEAKIMQKTKSFLDDSFEQIKTFSDGVASSIRNSNTCPDEFEIEFAVKFGADAGIIISSISTEANVKIKMKWIKDKEN